MKNWISLIVIVGFVIHSWATGKSSQIEHEIAGTYAREYTIKIIQPESGVEVWNMNYKGHYITFIG